MKRYIWVLKAEVESHLKGAGGVSAAYVLPKSFAPTNPADLAGGRIWMVLRNVRGDVFFAHVCVEVVEQFSDGLSDGDYLLTTNFCGSYRCATSYASGVASFSVKETSAFSIGLHEVDTDFFETLSAKTGTIATKLRKPDSLVLDRIVKRLSQENFSPEAKDVLATTIGHLSLEDVWAGRSPDLPPFANFAYHAISMVHGEMVAENLTNDLSRLDPTVTQALVSEDTNSPRDRVRKPVVDVNLLPIDLDRIFARRFIAQHNSGNLADAIKKTERAEKRHQDMLRDMAERLTFLGFLPLQSSSIDLFTVTKSGVVSCEIKTATRQNVLDQAAKGVFQLGCYKIALLANGHRNVKMTLIMETTRDGDLDSYVFDVLSSLDLRVLFYDRDRSWPDRLKGLEDVLEG